MSTSALSPSQFGITTAPDGRSIYSDQDSQAHDLHVAHSLREKRDDNHHFYPKSGA